MVEIQDSNNTTSAMANSIIIKMVTNSNSNSNDDQATDHQLLKGHTVGPVMINFQHPVKFHVSGINNVKTRMTVTATT